MRIIFASIIFKLQELSNLKSLYLQIANRRTISTGATTAEARLQCAALLEQYRMVYVELVNGLCLMLVQSQGCVGGTKTKFCYIVDALSDVAGTYAARQLWSLSVLRFDTLPSAWAHVVTVVASMGNDTVLMGAVKCARVATECS